MGRSDALSADVRYRVPEMIRRVAEPWTESVEFNRALELRSTWWIRTARPRTFYLSYRQALTGWWGEKWPCKLWWRIEGHYGSWQVRDSEGTTWGPCLTFRGARHLADGLNSHKPELAAVIERVS